MKNLEEEHQTTSTEHLLLHTKSGDNIEHRLSASPLVQDGTLEKLVQKRYESFTSGLGAKIEVSCAYLNYHREFERLLCSCVLNVGILEDGARFNFGLSW